MKSVRPVLWRDDVALRFLWRTSDRTEQTRQNAEAICAIAKSVVALGWGIDMVVAHGSLISEEEAAALPGERWLPVQGDDSNVLRVPKAGTLDDLVQRHERFLARLHQDDDGKVTFSAPPPITVFDTVGYRPATQPQPRSFAAFSVLRPDGTRFRPFDTADRALSVAGMLRHATKGAAVVAGRPNTWVNTFVLGHGESTGATLHQPVGAARFAYIPLPSIEVRGSDGSFHVGNVRRVMVTCFAAGHEADIDWVGRTVSGRELVDEKVKEPIALLKRLPERDGVMARYTQPSSTWATVTPVVLPGFDDPEHFRRRLRKGTTADVQKRLLGQLDARIEGLLRKAIVQAGLSPTLAKHASLEWRKVGFLPGTEPADRYGIPSHLRRYPRLHVRVIWQNSDGRPAEIPGPLCIGGGRFFGLGLFVAAPSNKG